MIVLLLLWNGLAWAQLGRNCTPCHSEQVDDVRGHKHGAAGVTCEVCHGASQKHRDALGAAAPDKVAGPDEVPALCGGCHTGQLKDYALSRHGKIVAAKSEQRAANCATCHGVHAARNVVAMKRQCDRCHASLPQACTRAGVAATAGRLVCASCHAPHTLARVK
ncbi:MAG: cytochrome c3 family protein [Acidobacteria bacterium]|nr:cytochrome c3 family protein [Acidobacteriota bacterium]